MSEGNVEIVRRPRWEWRRDTWPVMPSAKIGKQAAAYPPGYKVPSLVRVAVYAPAARSRAVRRFLWERPVSRWRTYIAGSYFHMVVRRLGESDFTFLTSVSEDAELTMFTMGTYRGREGWRQALTTWRETLDVSLEVSEFINLGADSRVLVEIRTTGRASGLDVEDINYLVVQVEDGQATWGQFYRDRDEALEAAGLSK
jgi:ketosteroid isomerase-like protein